MTNSATVANLFSKPAHGSPIVPKDELSLLEGVGILGDISANSMSPRQVLLTSKETMEKFGLLPGLLRENITVNMCNVNDFTSGTLLKVGMEVVLRVTVACEACDYIESLRTGLSRQIINERGVLATVIQGGNISNGDKIVVMSERYPSLPTTRFGRFLWFVSKIPTTRVVTYSQIIDAIGGIKAHYRAIPTYIKNANHTKYPLHRIVDSKGHMITHIPQQAYLLTLEGVKIEDGKVDLPLFQWHPESLYTNVDFCHT